MGTDLDLDDVAAQSASAMAELLALRTVIETLRRQLDTAPRGVSAEADFDQLTWTFSIGPDVSVGAGIYALVWLGAP